MFKLASGQRTTVLGGMLAAWVNNLVYKSYDISVSLVVVMVGSVYRFPVTKTFSFVSKGMCKAYTAAVIQADHSTECVDFNGQFCIHRNDVYGYFLQLL